MNVEKILSQEKLFNFEGERGVKNLAVLCRMLGYKDFQSYGQFRSSNGTTACYGDIFEMLKDNPGAIQAIINFLIDQSPNEENEEDLKEK